jgi:hypothetical protein
LIINGLGFFEIKKNSSFIIHHSSFPKLVMRFILLLLCVVFGLFPAGAQSKADRRVLAAEDLRFALMTQKNTQKLADKLHPDLVYVHSNALVETKQQHLDAINAGKLVYKSMTPENRTLLRYGKTALTNGIIHVQGIINGKDFDVRLNYIALYRRKGHNWQLLNWQSTRL